MQERFLECFYSQDRQRENTRFYNDFGTDNIPFGIASSPTRKTPSVSVRHNDLVFFLDGLAESGYLPTVRETTKKTFSEKTLNAFASLGKSERIRVREAVQYFISDCPKCPPNSCPLRICVANSSAICHISDATLYLPFLIGDFTDFSCSLNHVLNASEAIFKKREPPPAFHHFPVGYTGRTSSIVVSGTSVIRPKGQYRDAKGNIIFGPSKRLDYELEVGAFICKANEMGKSVSLEDAEDHIFGVVLLNDWSARDIQALEMNPLGPLNGKSFCTTISPWVITLEALAPFKVPGPARIQDVELASYLQPGSTTYDFKLTAELKLNDSSRQIGSDIGFTICQSHFSYLYWTLADLVAQQTINGCNLNVGDLLATGTISGDSEEKRGCLMESPSGIFSTSPNHSADRIKSLDDGVTITLTGKAGDGIGFGECTGTIQPAIVDPK